MKRNQYGTSDILLIDTKRMPDGTYWPISCGVIGQRKTINGQEVDDQGLPKRKTGQPD